MNRRKRKTLYHCTYSLDGVNLLHLFSKRIYRTRRFIRNNGKNVIACWRLTHTKDKSTCERIYRRLEDGEPESYYNNVIRAKVENTC